MDHQTTTMMTLTMRLEASRARADFVDHDFFRDVETMPLSTPQAAICVGQWWHPLHYFVTFLARCVAVIPDIASKSAVGVILSQESGAGEMRRAHEVIYRDTMERAGFTRQQIVASDPFPETVALVQGYERMSESALPALGSIFATEVTDLQMVSSIGTVVGRATGVTDLEWVDIHVEQEPDHVDEANHTMLQRFCPDEEDVVAENAEEMWRLWTGFFDRLHHEIARYPCAPWRGAAGGGPTGTGTHA